MAAKSPANIQFNYLKTSFRLQSPKKTCAWIEKVVRSNGSDVGSISYVFCTDSYLLKINKDYLHHDALTDIITFEYTDPGSKDLEGEIYISVPRVRENASSLKVEFDTELHRVIIHGVLHLLGYSDKTAPQRKRMRKMEEECLAMR